MELSGEPVTVLKSGSYFGEIGLLRETRRNATVRALSPTLDLFVLTKVGFRFKSIVSELHDRLTPVEV